MHKKSFCCDLVLMQHSPNSEYLIYTHPAKYKPLPYIKHLDGEEEEGQRCASSTSLFTARLRRVRDGETREGEY